MRTATGCSVVTDLDRLPDYCGVGLFGESLFQLPAASEIDEDELREMYPEVMEELDNE